MVEKVMNKKLVIILALLIAWNVANTYHICVLTKNTSDLLRIADSLANVSAIMLDKLTNLATAVLWLKDRFYPNFI